MPNTFIITNLLERTILIGRLGVHLTHSVKAMGGGLSVSQPITPGKERLGDSGRYSIEGGRSLVGNIQFSITFGHYVK